MDLVGEAAAVLKCYVDGRRRAVDELKDICCFLYALGLLENLICSVGCPLRRGCAPCFQLVAPMVDIAFAPVVGIVVGHAAKPGRASCRGHLTRPRAFQVILRIYTYIWNVGDFKNFLLWFSFGGSSR